MARISALERQHLGRIRPELWEKILELNDRANSDLGFTLAVPDYGGTRTAAQQEALYADSVSQGGGQLAYPVGKVGHSRHQYGAAVDEHIVAGGSADDGTGTDDDYHKLADLGESIGLEAGYYFDVRYPPSLRDRYHFQLKESLQDSIDRWNAMRQAGIVQAVAVAALTVTLGAIARRILT